jgi:hypothetical protein
LKLITAQNAEEFGSTAENWTKLLSEPVLALQTQALPAKVKATINPSNQVLINQTSQASANRLNPVLISRLNPAISRRNPVSINRINQVLISRTKYTIPTRRITDITKNIKNANRF